MPDNSGDAPSGLAENRASPRMRPVLRGLRSLWKPYEVTFSSLVVLHLPSPARPLVTPPRRALSTTHWLAQSLFPRPSPTAVALVLLPLPYLVWEEWARLIGPGFSVPPSPGLSPIPQLYDISSDETHRQLIAFRHWATLDQYRSLYCFGFYDAVAHAALYEALASIKRAASAAQPPGEEDLRLLEAGMAAYDVSNKHRRDFLAFIRLNASNDADARTKTIAQVVRRSLLKPGFADYGSEAVAQLSDELLRREAEYSVPAAAKAAVQQRFGVGPDPNEEEEDDDEPPSRARRRRPLERLSHTVILTRCPDRFPAPSFTGNIVRARVRGLPR
eukprot:jgi/Tetstr1/441167/TSEL_029425.t1